MQKLPHWDLLALDGHSSLKKQICRGDEEEMLWSNDPDFSIHVLCDILVISYIWAALFSHAQGRDWFLSSLPAWHSVTTCARLSPSWSSSRSFHLSVVDSPLEFVSCHLVFGPLHDPALLSVFSTYVSSSAWTYWWALWRRGIFFLCPLTHHCLIWGW